MSIKTFLKQPDAGKTVIEFVQELHPLIEKMAEEIDANQWEIAITLIIELSGITVAGKLDKELILEFLSYLINETEENLEEYSFSTVNSTTKH
mgnify:CR=1 FL=1